MWTPQPRPPERTDHGHDEAGARREGRGARPAGRRAERASWSTTTRTTGRCTPSSSPTPATRSPRRGRGRGDRRRRSGILPDLVVMDLSLPVIDGWEATRRLKADDRTTAHPGPGADGTRARRAGGPLEERPRRRLRCASSRSRVRPRGCSSWSTRRSRATRRSVRKVRVQLSKRPARWLTPVRGVSQGARG